MLFVSFFDHIFSRRASVFAGRVEAGQGLAYNNNNNDKEMQGDPQDDVQVQDDTDDSVPRVFHQQALDEHNDDVQFYEHLSERLEQERDRYRQERDRYRQLYMDLLADRLGQPADEGGGDDGGGGQDEAV